MKNFRKFLGFGILAASFAAAGATEGFGQSNCDDVEGQTKSYTSFTENFQSKDTAKLQVALDAGKEFLQKYGECADLKQQTDYIKPWVPRLETSIKRIKDDAEVNAMFGRFDAAIKAGNTTQVWATGREILAKQPGNANVIMVMGAVGLDDAIKGVPATADETIRYAQIALDYAKNPNSDFPKIRAADNQKTAGAFQYEYSRPEAVDQMTYALGYVHYYSKKDKKSALPYFYELSQSSARFKSDVLIYAAIGAYYTDEALRVGNEIKPMIDRLNAATTDEEKIALDKQIKAKEAVYKAYEERTLDAFGRAYKFAKNTTPAEKTYRDNLYKTIQEIYKSRFEKTEGVDAWISATTAKPMPNPLSEVTPVVEEDTTTTTTTTSALPAASTGAKATAAVSKP